MAAAEFQRARSAQAKQLRETAILDAARQLATERGVREITLTDIAGSVGMHKSAMLRYFETREEIFLRLAAAEWQEWSRSARDQLDRSLGRPPEGSMEQARTAAHVLATSLVDQPLFCDLLAHTPLSLERNVSLATVRSFKLTALAASGAVAEALHHRLPSLTPEHARSVVTTATAMAGALWQMAAPGTHLRQFYETEPELAHAVVEVAPRLTDILNGLLIGYST